MAISDELKSEIQEAVESIPAGDPDVGGDPDRDNTKDQDDTKDKDDLVGDSKDKDDTDRDDPKDQDTVDQDDTEDKDDTKDDVKDDDGDEQNFASPPPSPRSNTLQERAVRLGLTLAEAQAFPSDQSLDGVCEGLERQQAVLAADDKETKVDPLDKLENLDPEFYEPEAIEMFGVLSKEIRAQREELAALKSGQEQSSQFGQDVAAREVEQWFDSQIEGLGKDFSNCLGTGGHKSLAPGSSQLVKREEIAEQISVMLAGYHATGKAVPPREEMFKKAARLVLEDEFNANRERTLKSSLEKRSRQHISRAGKRGEKTSDESPIDEIAAIVDKKYFNG